MSMTDGVSVFTQIPNGLAMAVTASGTRGPIQYEGWGLSQRLHLLLKTLMHY